MALDPIKTFNSLSEAYKEFLNAQFTFRNPGIDSEAKKALENENNLLRGPFIEANMPYKGSNTLADLVKEGLLNKNIRKAFSQEEYAIYKRYNHQEKAIRMIKQKKSVIIASGTGSGKTECFFIPIINELLEENNNRTLCPGVRALLIYPMNALANDQIERLRKSLKNLPEITFGRYIGETPYGNQLNIGKGRKEAEDNYRLTYNEEPLTNELLTRAEMENSPPHILITNYAMLEYMLLRSTSQKIFKGQYSKNFKFLVLDEAHTYKGAHGTEVAMLIRRLKEAIFGRIDNCFTCIGTSATLGGGQEELRDIVEFSKDLFNEDFSAGSIITSDRQPLEIVNTEMNNLDYYSKLFEEYKDYTENDKSSKLYSILSKDRFVYEIKKRILEKTLTISELAELLKQELSLEDKNLPQIITEVIELCGQAISPKDGNPLLNAKYHVFARTLEGGFITFTDGIKVFTNRRKEYNGYKVYELLNCMKCGQEYITGSIETINGEEYLIPSEEDDNALFMLAIEEKHVSIDEDESSEDIEEFDENSKLEYAMCPKCGKLFPAKAEKSIKCCEIDFQNFIKITKIPPKARKNNCFKCGKLNKGTIRRLTTSEDTAIEMLTRKLYQLLPDEKKKGKTEFSANIWGNFSSENTIPKGHKLLVFSDNRQDAAKFAIFIQERYNDWLWKNIIYNEIKNMAESSISFNILLKRIYNTANSHNLFYNERTSEEKENLAKTQLMKEVIELNPRMSLNRLGMINIRIVGLEKITENKVSEHFCNDYQINKEEFFSLVYFLFDSLRRQGCVEFPEGIDQTDDAFEPKNRYTFFKQKGGMKEKDTQIYGFEPSDGKTNSRLHYVQRFFENKGISIEKAKNKALDFIKEIAGAFVTDFFEREIPILKKGDRHYFQLRLDCIIFEKQNQNFYVCQKCGETSKTNLFGICSKTNCDGSLIEVYNDEDRGNYYRQSFSNIKLIPMNAKEHTAQLSSQTATDVQKSFRENNVNILSCSTTFEMGVDIGSLEAVVLRNVPPETANYVQRAGRAGRRGSSSALILTFAKRRSHDLTFFNDPVKMINGEIKAPYIELNNEYLVRRHVHSVIFSFLNSQSINLKTVNDLIGAEDGQSLNLKVYNILQEKPQELFNSLNIIVPEGIKKDIGIDENWSFVKKFVDNNNSNNEEACFDIAINNFLAKFNDLKQSQENFSSQEKYIEANKLKKLINTYVNQDYISFLAENNVLPRYGFPVYVVPLKLNTDDIVKDSIDLDRDLRMAITEYAPGGQVVAYGKYWKPHSLIKQPNKEWPTYDFAVCEGCGKIYFYETALGVESIRREVLCCNKPLRYKQMIIPQFGFITKKGDKESVKLKDEVRYFSEAFFNGFENQSQVEKQVISLRDKEIISSYSSHGEMFVLNRGKYASKEKNIGLSFRVCEKCGYVDIQRTTTTTGNEKGHKTYNNGTCHGKLIPCYLGHHFISDVLVLNLPKFKGLNEEYESILYAIIEGASKFMEIDRGEIGGAVWHNGDINNFSLAIFDTVPNGAGHVKRMTKNISSILESALEKVDGKCGCGEETCCYGCLRNYDNQAYHDTMSRGQAKKYLSWILSKNRT